MYRYTALYISLLLTETNISARTSCLPVDAEARGYDCQNLASNAIY